MAVERTRVAVVGAGFSGIGMAIGMKRAGIDDFLLLERADDVGGTWRDNTYPGCAVDVGSHIYCFSFEPNPDWSSTLSPQAEIQAYLQHCTDRYGVRPHLRLGHEMTAAAWDEEAKLWRISTSRGEIEADVFIQATGPLSTPWVPDLPGRDRFEGTSFHSAEWDHDHDLSGERVAVIGTGASSVQIVPAIQPEVGRLLVFQRTPPWVIYRADRRMSELEHRVYRRIPFVQRIARFGLFFGHEAVTIGVKNPPILKAFEKIVWARVWQQVRDPELRAKLRPNYRLACKRMLLSNDYYPALLEPNVDLVTEGIGEIRERSIVTTDGTEHEVDTIVWATGFHVTDSPINDRVRGRDGVVLGDLWTRNSPRALRGSAVPGFPNHFIMVGPNTGTGNNTLIYMIESQARYIVDALRLLRSRPLAAVEAREDAMEEWNRMLDERLSRTVWATGCSSHYLDRHGHNAALWPDFMVRFRAQTRRFDPSEYVLYEAESPNGRPQPSPARTEPAADAL